MPNCLPPDCRSFSTYAGGSAADEGKGIAVSSGEAWLTGSTASSNYPTTGSGVPGDVWRQHGCGGDAPQRQRHGVEGPQFLGGAGTDVGYALTLDAGGLASIAGSTTGSFTTTFTAYDTTYNGGSTDAFVAQAADVGGGPPMTLVMGSYLGGSGDDVGRGVAVDTSNAVVTGSTTSTNFPTAHAVQGSNAGGTDLFVSELGIMGLTFSTYYGGGRAPTSAPTCGVPGGIDAGHQRQHDVERLSDGGRRAEQLRGQHRRRWRWC